MDGDQKRKRKMVASEAEEDITEEEKMEKFYALIRSTRDIRERMVIMSNAERQRLEEDQKKKTNNLDNQNMQIAVWNPTFQPEDFMEDRPPVVQQEISNTPPAPVVIANQEEEEEAGPSNSKKGDDVGKAQEEDDQDKGGGEYHRHDLDLNLSL